MRKTSNWRNSARQRIVTVGNRLIRENPEADLEWVRAEISKTYPFGLRENYPYQIWLQELSAYIESWKPQSSWCTGEAKPPKTWNRREAKPIPAVEGQLNLFDSSEEEGTQ